VSLLSVHVNQSCLIRINADDSLSLAIPFVVEDSATGAAQVVR